MASYLTSIPVSIPYSWQKRLLVFALQRLDLIDVQGLDLDNLGGLTWGRRSVVELRNVSLKITTLAERAKLPSSIFIEHASISVLRLTIPADLAVDPINVEVEGVKVSARVRKDEDYISTPRGKAAPSHKDTANRPRLATPTVHDPGGRRDAADSTLAESPHMLPTSKDLAASFLESEPQAQREQLEAIVGSQSSYMDQSTSSSTSSGESEAGLGLPGGFALPTFLTNFFQGVADRLTVGIVDVEVYVTLEVDAADEPGTKEHSVRLRVAEIDVGSLLATASSDQTVKPVRRFALRGLQLEVEVDPEIFSHPSSPRLDRHSLKSSSSHLHSSMASTEYRDRATLAEYPDLASDTSSQSNASRTEDNVQQRDTAYSTNVLHNSSSQYPESSAPPTPGGMTGQQSQYEDYPTASRLGASRSTIRQPQGSHYHPDDGLGVGTDTSRLTESTIFTHDQAQSMYASAISHATAGTDQSLFMPGGWSDSILPSQADTVPLGGVSAPTKPVAPPTEVSTATIPQTSTADESPTSKSMSAEGGPVPSKVASPTTLPPSRSFIRLLALEFVDIVLPTVSENAADGHANAAPAAPLPGSIAAGGLQESAYSVSLAASRLQLHPSSHAHHTPTANKLKIRAGQLRIDADLGICKLLVRIAAGVSRHVMPKGTSDSRKLSADSRPAGLPHLSVGLPEFLLNFHEGRNFRATLDGTSGQPQTDEALLSLSLRGIEAVDDIASRRQLTISTIKLRHAARDVLRFTDRVNVRDSIASSAMLRQHDLTLSMDSQRTEIFTKPVEGVVDLLLVDEVLSRGGGLDSLIDLGNSIVSTHSSMSPSMKPETKQQTRSVRFTDTSHHRTRSSSDASTSIGKLNIRIDGAMLHLNGSESSVTVKTSAIKFVMRPTMTRVVIDGTMIEGPIVGTQSPPLYARIKSLDLVYHETPEEKDLDRLLSLITPSNDKYDEEDDIMVDTLLKQRRKGGVIRLDIKEIQLKVLGLDWQQHITQLSDELAKLTAVTKYLPEDDRPGVLIFALIHTLDLQCTLDDEFGKLALRADLIEAAQISVPSLSAAQVSSWSLTSNKNDVLIGEVTPQDDSAMGSPMLMFRFIADEMEPTVRLKLTNTCIEYKVPTLMALKDLAKRLEGTRPPSTEPVKTLSPASSRTSDMSDFARKVKVSVTFRDSAAALNPVDSQARGLFVLIDTTLGYEAHKKGSHFDLSMRKASLLIVNNIGRLQEESDGVDSKRYFDQTDQIQRLTKLGYVPVASFSSAAADIRLTDDQENSSQHIDVALNNPLLFMETCADSTQTLFGILGALSPPTAPSTQAQYRTEVVPIENMLASFTGEAFVTEPGPELGLQASRISVPTTSQHLDMDDSGLLGAMYEDEEADDDMLAESYAESDLTRSAASSLHVGPVDVEAPGSEDLTQSVMIHSMLDFRDEHFAPKTNIGGTAHRWNSTRNTYELANEVADKKSPVTVKVRGLHIIWNLFDGYDWHDTRETISQAVRDAEEKAMSRRRSSRSPGLDEDEDFVGDVLFNSIYISIPANKDPRDLTSAINYDIDDMVSETGSYATSTTVTATTSRQARRQSSLKPRPKKLRLSRSKHHKISFELQGVAADFVALPPDSGEVQSSVDVRVHKLEIFDNVPTSTWKKFATYLHEAGEREVDTSMVHVEMLNVRPVPELAATEIVMKITILPLRLHVDQDALDFMTRFFEFKDDTVPISSAPSAPPFIQRVEVNPVRLQLDYKPKKVDYAGLRSGRTTEFMNFIILERTNMVLRRVILYGVSGFDRMGIMLNNIWSPDVRRNQLPTVLAGLAPVRPLVDVASGVRELVAVPIREYQKDGRIVRSIQKGAFAFAKTTATELVNLGAKLAIGTQQILQNAEGVLVPGTQNEEDPNSEATRQISLYADQPVGIVQGLRGAYASLERDLLLARDAIVAVPGEVMASGTAVGAAKAVLKQSPTIILRPAIGATKAVGQTLMGAGNTLDRKNLRRIEDVSCLIPILSYLWGHH
jgi:autophagy-related protein 2